MSQENVERLIQRMFDAFNAEGLAGVSPFFDPQVEYRDDPEWPGGGAHHGRDAVIARFREVIEALGIEEARLDRVVEAGEQTVWIVGFRGHSTGAGVPNDHLWGYTGRIVDGQLVDFQAYIDPTDALEAAGLRE